MAGVFLQLGALGVYNDNHWILGAVTVLMVPLTCPGPWCITRSDGMSSI